GNDPVSTNRPRIRLRIPLTALHPARRRLHRNPGVRKTPRPINHSRQPNRRFPPLPGTKQIPIEKTLNTPLNLPTSQPPNLPTSHPLNLPTSHLLNLSTSQPLNFLTS